MAGIRQLVIQYPVNVHLIGWDKKKLTPYIVDLPSNVVYRHRSSFNNFYELFSYAKEVNPHAVFVSGWMDKDYVRVARELKKQGKKIIAFVDNQWSGNLRQLIGSILAPWFVKRNFNIVWVSGSKQKLFAKKMGFRSEEIYSGFYTADTDFFHSVHEARKKYIKENGYPRNITFLGRLAEIKNVKYLVETFIQFKDQWPDWTLTIIGNGPLKEKILQMASGSKNVIIKDFMQPQLLREDIIRTGIFCLPSIQEPWGVVIHEFAAAGIPMIVSDICGAATYFIEEGRNGYLIKKDNKYELKDKILKMTSLSHEQLMRMGERSNQLSYKITPSKWAAKLIIIINSVELPYTIKSKELEN